MPDLSNRLYMSDVDYKIFSDIIDRILPDTEIWIYGSRINGNATDSSDLDIVIIDDSADNLPIFDLKQAFQESGLSFRVDIMLWSEIPENFRKNILKDHIRFKKI